MVEMNKIEALTSQIVSAFKPERIIMFGSYADGRASDDSDIDLLVILQFEGKPVRKAIEIRNAIKARLPLDLIVRTPEQLAERLAQNDWFMRDIVEKGRTLYEANHH